jgi:transcription-repair coupling factor (superfamily II helicase)
VREVGIELYQNMLEEAVASMRAGKDGRDCRHLVAHDQSRRAVLIPETYVPDLNVRMALYRRLSELEDTRAVDGFAAELIDRFGPAARGGRASVRIVAIKHL